jgi:HAD superfamily hydrolase (TIGR01458 family)
VREILRNVKGILFDLDGVVHVGEAAVDRAADTLGRIRELGIPHLFITNTTTKSPRDLHEKMSRLGLPIDKDAILTTHEVARDYLGRHGNPSCYLLVGEGIRGAYRDCATNEQDPEYIVIGDIGDAWNYDILNRVFNMVMNGSKMLALHKGRYWQTEQGLQMDIGAFVTGLEYASGREAIVVGKPARAFFETGLDRLELDRSEVVMVGDDIENDVGGAQAAGIRGVLVKTGKYRAEEVRRSKVEPDAVIESVADLMSLIQN